MRTKNRNINYTSSLSLKAILNACLIGCLTVGAVSSAMADSREQARRMHDRLTGVPPTDAVLAEMESLINANNPEDAARADARYTDRPEHAGHPRFPRGDTRELEG